ncbi:MAG: hypothetical protein AAFR17_18415 [Pseudomonadota bacterium]
MIAPAGLSALLAARALGCRWVRTMGGPPPLLLHQPDLHWMAPDGSRCVLGAREMGWREVIAAPRGSLPGHGLCLDPTDALLAADRLVWLREGGAPPGYRPLRLPPDRLFLRTDLGDGGSATIELAAPKLDDLLGALHHCTAIASSAFSGGAGLDLHLDPLPLLACDVPRQRAALQAGEVVLGRLPLSLTLPEMPLPLADLRILCLGAGRPPKAAGFEVERRDGGAILTGTPGTAGPLTLSAPGPGWRVERVTARLALPEAWVDRTPVVDPLAHYASDPFGTRNMG